MNFFLDPDSELVPIRNRTWRKKSDPDPDKRDPDPKH